MDSINVYLITCTLDFTPASERVPEIIRSQPSDMPFSAVSKSYYEEFIQLIDL